MINQTDISLPNKPKNNLLVILGILALVFIVALGSLYFSKTRIPEPTIYPDKLTEDKPTPPVILGNWETYSNPEFNYSISLPTDFKPVRNGDRSTLFRKETVESVGPINFIYISVFAKDLETPGGEIYNVNTEEINTLMSINVGETKSLRYGANNPELEKYFNYTRLPNAKIGGFIAKVYVNNSPWEFPEGTKEYRYYVEKGNDLFLIGGYLDNMGAAAIPEDLFKKILETFKFTN